MKVARPGLPPLRAAPAAAAAATFAPGSGDAALLPVLLASRDPALLPLPSNKPGVVRSTPSAEGSRIHAVRAIISARCGSATLPYAPGPGTLLPAPFSGVQRMRIVHDGAAGRRDTPCRLKAAGPLTSHGLKGDAERLRSE